MLSIHLNVLTPCGFSIFCVLQSLQWSAQRLKSIWHLWTPLWRCTAKLMVPHPPLSHGIKTGSRWLNLYASGCSVQDPCRSPSSSQAILEDTLALLPMQRALSALWWASQYRVSFSQYSISSHITKHHTLCLYNNNLKPQFTWNLKYHFSLKRWCCYLAHHMHFTRYTICDCKEFFVVQHFPDLKLVIQLICLKM